MARLVLAPVLVLLAAPAAADVAVLVELFTSEGGSFCPPADAAPLTGGAGYQRIEGLRARLVVSRWFAATRHAQVENRLSPRKLPRCVTIPDQDLLRRILGVGGVP